MANQNEELLLTEADFDFDALEQSLEQEFNEKNLDLELAVQDREKIGNPQCLVETVGNVAWDQFVNMTGAYLGEDFVKENKGLEIDLSDDAHIQTVENFEKGKIAKHNYKSGKMLESNYKRYKEKPHSEFRKKFVDPTMDSTLPRVGKLKKKGIETVTDIYTGRKISTETTLPDGSWNQMAAQREHVISSAELYKDPSLQMANSSQELAAIINNPENLRGYTTAKRNNSKSDNSPSEMKDCDKTKHWETANKKAEEYIDKTKKEGEEQLRKEGIESQKHEKDLLKKELTRSVVMTLLAALIREILQKLVAWFRAGKRNISTFIDALKESLKSFLSNLKQYLLNVGDVLLTTVFAAIWGPIVGTLKKVWMFLKQGYKSLKEAISFFQNPANQNMPFSIKVMEAGKILIASLTAGGAILLSEVIEKGLMAVAPPLADPIPLLGSLASLLGLFSGALVSGIIGAIGLNLIDKLVANKQRALADKEIIKTGNEILLIQGKQLELEQQRVAYTKERVEASINVRHTDAVAVMKDKIQGIRDVSESIQERNEQVFDEQRDNQLSEEFDTDLQEICNVLK